MNHSSENKYSEAFEEQQLSSGPAPGYHVAYSIRTSRVMDPKRQDQQSTDGNNPLLTKDSGNGHDSITMENGLDSHHKSSGI